MVVTKTLHLIRHGATTWSQGGRLCGWSDVSLSREGKEQALTLRAAIGSRSFAGVWTSDLRRARQFAELVSEWAAPDRRLREIDFGELEGMTWDECDLVVQAALGDFDHFLAPGGESVAELRARVVEFVEELPAGDHLVFTHGGVIRALTRLAGTEQAPSPGEMVSLTWDSTR